MAISSTAGTWAQQQPSGGQALGQECHIASYLITAPVDSGTPTGFAVTIPGLTVAGTRIMGLVAKSATAGALIGHATGLYVAVTADTLTFNHASGALAGTEVWDVTIMTQT
jgi:hypothetical protein